MLLVKTAPESGYATPEAVTPELPSTVVWIVVVEAVGWTKF